MKKILSLIMAMGIVMVLFTGCDEGQNTYMGSVDQQQKAQQEQMQKDMSNQVGMPNIKEWSEKKMMKEIIELRDNSKLVTYAYLQNLNGKFVFLGKCIGYGLPYSTQYTNPEKVDTVDGGEYGAENPYTLAQSDPNGLFSGDGVSATWLQYINPDTGKREVIYCEPNIIVTQSKLPKRLCEEWSLPKDY
jgi:hypothetical protein